MCDRGLNSIFNMNIHFKMIQLLKTSLEFKLMDFLKLTERKMWLKLDVPSWWYRGYIWLLTIVVLCNKHWKDMLFNVTDIRWLLDGCELVMFVISGHRMQAPGLGGTRWGLVQWGTCFLVFILLRKLRVKVIKNRAVICCKHTFGITHFVQTMKKRKRSVLKTLL